MPRSHHAFFLIFCCSGQSFKLEAGLTDIDVLPPSGRESYCRVVPSPCPRVECLNSNMPAAFLGGVTAHVPCLSLTLL